MDLFRMQFFFRLLLRIWIKIVDSGELRFHPTLWPMAINDEIARGVYARTGLADNIDRVVGLGGRTLIGTQTEKW